VPLEIVSWRLTALGPDIAFGEAAAPTTSTGKPRTHRAVALWPKAGEVPVFDRASLAVDQTLTGPAIIEERETTIVLPPGWTGTVDRLGCIAAKRESA
jgi:N-methylhydantoinase A